MDRSRGVGVFLLHQLPNDVPNEVLLPSGCGASSICPRAFTPMTRKACRGPSAHLPENRCRRAGFGWGTSLGNRRKQSSQCYGKRRPDPGGLDQTGATRSLLAAMRAMTHRHCGKAKTPAGAYGETKDAESDVREDRTDKSKKLRRAAGASGGRSARRPRKKPGWFSRFVSRSASRPPPGAGNTRL